MLCNHSACFCVSECIMMIGQIKSACSSYRMKLMIRQSLSEMPSGCRQSIIILIVRIIHPVTFERSLQTTNVESCIMCHQRQILNQGFNIPPDIPEDSRSASIRIRQTVHSDTEPLVVLRLRFDKTIIAVDNLSVSYNNNPYTAHTGRTLVGSLKINCGKIPHNTSISLLFGQKAEKPVWQS